jgi:protein gp37
MGEHTKIEWAHHTFNPWIGCERVSAECRNCYAETWDARGLNGPETHWGKDAPRRRTSDANWRLPLRWDRRATADGVRRRVFCASLADVFEDRDDLDPWRTDLWDLIEATSNLDWLLLTKRPESIACLAPRRWSCEPGNLMCDRCGASASIPLGMSCPDHAPRGTGMPRNIWLGTSVGHQSTIDRVNFLADASNGAPTFLSCEPLLGPLDFGTGGLNGIDWVIAGGESGPKARPMHPDWVRSIRDVCLDSGVPFLFKQWGEFDASGDRVGKKAAGRILDGRTWDQVPS